jgi:hypothetical protein
MRLVEIIIIELELDYSSENLSYYLIVLFTYSKNRQSDEVVIAQHFLRSLKCVSNEHKKKLYVAWIIWNEP